MFAPFIFAGGFGVILILIRTRSRRKRMHDFCNIEGRKSECEKKHGAKLSRITGQLKSRNSSAHLIIQKKTVSHQVPKAGDLKYSDDHIDIGDFDELIEIDTKNMTCTAEPGVTFVDLVAATMKHGLTPIMVPELKTITIGGAVAGCSIESASFVYGGFHDTCLEYEVVTAKGDVMTCTPDNENRLLFQMMHGTFGILTRMTFRLIPAKPYVRIVYEKYRDLDSFKRAITGHYEKRDIDFMDGMIHGTDEFVLCAGTFADKAPYVNRYDWVTTYYETTRERSEDYMRTEDYYFRYDRGVTNVHPKSIIGRFLLGKFIGSDEVLEVAEKLRWLLLKSEHPSVNVDIFIPFSKLDEFIKWYADEFRFFPLWCVPYRRVRDYEWLSENIFRELDDQLFLDLAIYGMKQEDGKNYHKIMEDKLIEIGGLKTLISHNYFSEDDFWKIWNKENYFAIKAITDPDNIFRNLYGKMCRASRGIEN